jgi:hypothetical protein
VTEQYEALRAGAFGEGLPLETRSGLALFLLRGMWGWVQAVTTSSMPLRSMCAGPSRSPVTEHNAVIQLFAAIAMSPTKRRGYERIHKSPIASSRA